MNQYKKNHVIDISVVFKSFRLLYRRYFDIQKFISACILTVLIIFSPFVKAANSPELVAEIQRLGGSIHLTFKGATQWEYDLERKNEESRTTIEIRVPKIDAGSIQRLQNWKDEAFIRSILVEPIEGTLQNLIVFELSDTKVETFDYLTDQPSRLIVDFYLKESKDKDSNKKEKHEGKSKKSESSKSESSKKDATESQNNKENSNTQLNTNASEKDKQQVDIKQKNAELAKKSKIKISEKEKNESSRKPAADELSFPNAGPGSSEEKVELPSRPNESRGIFDGGDPKFERFSMAEHDIKEEAIVRSQENLYIPFPMLQVETDHYSKIRSQPPVYEVTPKDTEENKFVRLILTLYDKNRLAVCLKTIRWFFEKYPKSEYDEIVRFVLGDLYFKLWDKDGSRTNYELGLQAYKEALMKYPKSPLAIRTVFLTGYSSYFNKDYFEVLRSFQNFTKDNPPSFLTDKARLTIARSLLKLLQYDDGYKTYEALEKDGATAESRNEATYLKGDIPFFKKDYEKAAKVYREAMSRVPAAWEKFPNAFYNLADSLFWLKQYKQSLDAYRDFLTRFPGHTHAAYAMTRVGELLEILGADKKRVQGAFMETYFRYGASEGSTVARMRNLSQKMRDMKAKEAESAISEIKKLSTGIELPKIDLFAAIMISEGLSQRGEFEKSIETLLNWYQNNSTTSEANLIRRRIVRYVNEKMAEDVDSNNFMAVLKLHNTYGELWLKDSKRIDTVYYLGRAFEQAGSYKEAETLYREALNRLYSSRTSNEVREHSVFEKLPSDETLSLRLANVAFEKNEFSKAYDYLKDIEHVNQLTEDEQVERVDIASRVMEKKGDLDSSIRYLKELAENWKGQPTKVVPVLLRLGNIYFDKNNLAESEKVLRHGIEILEDSQKVPDPIHFETLKALSRTLALTQKKEDHIEVLNDLLKNYEEKEKLSSYRYTLGELHFQLGQLQKATEIWKDLDKDKNKFWSNLANEQLKHAQWKESYKKYTQKIPTISKNKKKE